jgi:hypothetical protein
VHGKFAGTVETSSSTDTGTERCVFAVTLSVLLVLCCAVRIHIHIRTRTDCVYVEMFNTYVVIDIYFGWG